MHRVILSLGAKERALSLVRTTTTIVWLPGLSAVFRIEDQPRAPESERGIQLMSDKGETEADSMDWPWRLSN
jgi:hypothetical protein